MIASIEFLHELVDRFEKATAANRTTRGRSGAVVRLAAADADEVLVVGDLHGNRENYNRALKMAALERHPRRHLVLQEVVHGGPTYPNGGCKSHMLLEDVAALKVRYPDRVHYLLSNHELGEYLGSPLIKAGISQNLLFATGLEHAYGPAAARVFQCYRPFIRSCPLAILLENGVYIAHSVPPVKNFSRYDLRVFDRELTEADVSPGGAAYELVWGRDFSENHASSFCQAIKVKVLVTGHEPCASGYQRPNPQQLIFDASGAALYCCTVPVDGPVTADELERNLARLG